MKERRAMEWNAKPKLKYVYFSDFTALFQLSDG